MRKIKDLLKEFRDNFSNNNNNRNSGGGDPFTRLKQFMENTPFTHVTTGEHEIHFNSSQHAAEAVAHSLAKHELGRIHANRTGNVPLHEYFLSSTGTHDDVLDAIHHHIVNHPNLPDDLTEHLASYLEHIQSEEERKTHTLQQLGSMLAPRGMDGPQTDLGAYIAKKHSHDDMETTGVHPHLYDDAHHLQGVIQEIQDNDSHGYFLRKDEYKD